MSSSVKQGIYMTVDERKLYIETRTLEDCLVNFQLDEMSPKMRERLLEVFPTTDAAKTYVALAFDCYVEMENEKERYILSGFWNPNISGYEFE